METAAGEVSDANRSNSSRISLRNRVNSLMCGTNNSRSDDELEKCETKLLSDLKIPYTGRPVYLDDKRFIWTISLNEHIDQTPVVFLHGFGAGSALWMRNLDDFGTHRPVYTIDLLGFGRSSRVCIETDPSKTAESWAESIEEWRVKMSIDKMYLIAHSLGGYLSSFYAIRHPQRVKRLFLVEPWGYSEPPIDENGESIVHRPLFIRLVIRLLFAFHPLSILRLAGPFGPGIIKAVRPDLGRKYAPSPEIAPYIYKYIHHCNAKTPPAGEAAFKRIVDKNGYPLMPMIRRIGELPLSCPVTVVLGSDSWVDSDTGLHIRLARANFHNVDIEDSKVDVHIIAESGHHLYVEQFSKFNELINDILLKDDHK